jgi:hypothetical protein
MMISTLKTMDYHGFRQSNPPINLDQSPSDGPEISVLGFSFDGDINDC